ncbi:FeoC-like transcriptional regulator [Martelella alba]|uniref:Transcriptional regulator HTH-type FeoC domain-containing protein n=1 Tax=Martelella alba TaxID=2590451 RepID=A0ABY2SLU9_9HYPH|nr:FeoC-like transcriptional regulator [Martelella alba]TKI06576.1 hypothetical protein FCN80_10030 [Martelella alba]
MNLMALRDYIRDKQRVSLLDISSHFHSEPQVVSGMLDIWLQKNKIISYTVKSAKCGGCCCCDPASNRFYEWNDPARAGDIREQNAG